MKMKIKDITTALSLFEEAAINQAAAIEQGDYKTANKKYKEIKNSIAFLSKESATGYLREYLSNNSVGVRLWAATQLLLIDEKEAITVLKEIAGLKIIHALTAKMTISEWEKGNLKI
jgi:hypothetical protein